MSAHRIGLLASRHASAGYRSPRLPIIGERVPNGLPLPTPPKGRLVSGPRGDPFGARARAGPADRTTSV